MNEINCAYRDENGVCHLYSTWIKAVMCKGDADCKGFVEGDKE